MSSLSASPDFPLPVPAASNAHGVLRKAVWGEGRCAYTAKHAAASRQRTRAHALCGCPIIVHTGLADETGEKPYGTLTTRFMAGGLGAAVSGDEPGSADH